MYFILLKMAQYTNVGNFFTVLRSVPKNEGIVAGQACNVGSTREWLSGYHKSIPSANDSINFLLSILFLN